MYTVKMALSASTCRSDVWEFNEKNDSKVTCKLCSKELVYSQRNFKSS